MRKTLLLKSMATALLALGVGQAWADEGTATVKMTYVDGSNTSTAYGEISPALAGYNKISGGSVELANSGWGANYITYIQADASALEGNIVSATLTFEASGSTDSKRTTAWGVGYNSSTWSSDLTYDTADRTITLLGDAVAGTTKSASTFENYEFDVTAAFTNDADADKVVTLLVYETAAAGAYIQNPVVTVTYSTSAVATYTINYVDASGNVIKTARTDNGVVGYEVSLTDDDKASFYNDDSTVKYIYDSDDSEGMTIAESGTVVTVKFREAATCAYTVEASTGATIASGSAFEEDVVSVAYPRYVNVDGTLYEKSANTSDYHQSITLTSDNQVETFDYTATDITSVVYYSEAEDIEGMTSSSGNNANIRCSQGLGAYNAGGESGSDAVTVTTLDAGVYTITVQTRGKSGSAVALNVGEDEYTIDTQGYNLTSTVDVELSGTTAVTLPKTGSSTILYDYIYIQKTGEYTGVKEIAVEGVASDNKMYNLAGQRVSSSAKGVVIMNGKKYVK